VILDKILTHKRQELEQRRQEASMAEWKARALERPPALDLCAALRDPGIKLIAEIKRASPSRGPMAPALDAAATTETYVTHGATAISVLTDARFFSGHLDDLRAAVRRRDRLSASVPILRKDFVIDPLQVYESRAAGADALLLIVRALTPERLAELVSLTHHLGMTALVEIHEACETRHLQGLPVRLVGINSRDLRTFRTDPTRFSRIRVHLQRDTLVVAESGIRTPEDVHRAEEAGADAVLVGETIVTASDPAEMVRRLAGGHV